MRSFHFVRYFLFLLTLTTVYQTWSQGGTSANDPIKKRKVVRGCEYDVVPGLATIEQIKVTKSSEQSILKYDEYTILFSFQPMLGDRLIDELKGAKIPFYLRSGSLKVPVGPKYIDQYRLKVGTKYAMNILQNTVEDACLEAYTYESKALRNDLFEADVDENLYNYKKHAFSSNQQKMELAYEDKRTHPEENATPLVMSIDELRKQPDYSNLSDEELRQIAREEALKEMNENKDLSAEDLGLNESDLRAEIESKVRNEYAEKENATSADESSQNSVKDELKDQKNKAKEEERLRKLEEKQQKELLDKKKAREEEIRKEIEDEIRAKIEQEKQAQEAIEKRQQDENEKNEQRKLEKKRKALEKKESFKKEFMENMKQKSLMKECNYSARQSGTLQITSIKPSSTISDGSRLEVYIRFKPDTYESLTKKDRKMWDQSYLFILDPTGEASLPSQAYVDKHDIKVDMTFPGFAQTLNSGICSSMMMYAPQLPNDASMAKM